MSSKNDRSAHEKVAAGAAKKLGKKAASRAKSKVKSKARSAVKKAYKRNIVQKILPYVSVVFGIILAICVVAAKIYGEPDAVGAVGNILQLFFSGLLGTGVFLLPVWFGYAGVMWCVFHLKWRSSDMIPSSENYDDYRYAHKRAVSKSVFALITVLTVSVIFGIAPAADELVFDIGSLWDSAVDEAFAGGVIGGIIAYGSVAAFKSVISYIIFGILLALFAMLSVGLTPDYIIKRIQYRREMRSEIGDVDEISYEDNEKKRYEELRQKEFERAKKKRIKEIEANKIKEARLKAREEAERESLLADEPLAPPPAKNAAPKEEAKSAVEEKPSIDVDDFVNGIEEGEEDFDVFDDPTPTPITELSNENAANDAFEAKDYGGDPVIDGAQTFTVEELLSGLEPEAQSAAEATDTNKTPTYELNEIDNDELVEDLAEVAPEDGEVDIEPVLPYIFPPVDMLAQNQNVVDTDYKKELQENADLLMSTLKSFKVGIQEISYSRGPTITRYELKPEVGTRVRSIANLVDDISLNLATSGVRIEAPIPNKPLVGIEVPNRNRATVYLRDLIENPKFSEAKSRLTSCLGMDVGGNPIYFDISKMPHLLIAGATGMGKSVCINSIIISILYKARPDEVKLILIDPKKVEFNIYKNIPHLYAPIVSEPKKAAGALASAVAEMERRFELIEEVGVRDISTYNAVTENDPEKERMPHMVIIIDELADLMMTAPDEVESCICRLAQKARAAGIHIVIGTQRPSVDVITGLIKANIPSRIACTVASQVDSRTIIDIAGAEKLIGRGDMLFAPVGAAKPMRVQGAFVSEAEVEKIVTFIKDNNASAKYNADFINTMEENAKLCGLSKKAAAAASSDSGSEGGDASDDDPKFNDAVKLAIEEGKISTSLMQRRLGVGYGRAAKIIDVMEQKGYVSKPDGNKPRRVLITMEEYLRCVVGGGDAEPDAEE